MNKTITLTQDELYCLLNDAFIYKADLEIKKQYNKQDRPFTPAFEINEFIKQHSKIKHLKFGENISSDSYMKGNLYLIENARGGVTIVKCDGNEGRSKSCFSGVCIYDSSEFKQAGKSAINWDKENFLPLQV